MLMHKIYGNCAVLQVGIYSQRSLLVPLFVPRSFVKKGVWLPAVAARQTEAPTEPTAKSTTNTLIAKHKALSAAMSTSIASPILALYSRSCAQLLLRGFSCLDTKQAARAFCRQRTSTGIPTRGTRQALTTDQVCLAEAHYFSLLRPWAPNAAAVAEQAAAQLPRLLRILTRCGRNGSRYRHLARQCCICLSRRRKLQAWQGLAVVAVELDLLPVGGLRVNASAK